jgi:arylsulfatase A-like enzyme
LGVELGVGAVFFVSAMQILSTLLPASVNGIGLREATEVSLYTAVGVPPAVAFLVPTVGFAVEMSVSAFGGLVFLSRRVGYKPVIRVEHPEREDVTHAQIENAPRETWPRPKRGIAIGLGAGLLAGVLIGVSEAAVVLASGKGATDWSVPAYGAVAYGALFAVAGAGFGFVLAWSGRFIQRAAVAEPIAFGRIAALMTAVGALAIGLFRVRRDVFHESLKLKSGEGLLVLGGGLLCAAILYVLLSAIIGRLVARKPFAFMLRAWSAPAAALCLFAVAVTLSLAYAPAEAAFTAPAQRTAPAQGGNVLFVVVDTLRADHLPAYGHPRVKTPALDRLAADGVTFEHAYANASWTRPSFASLMTGRYPSSHQTTTKPDALPDGLVTLAEAMTDGGYTTLGVVTNYNVAPFFNFDQGFDHYTYLEPEFVLGASDTTAKLLFVQVLRQRIEAMRAAGGRVAPGSAYQDAATVNRVVLDLLDATPTKPWLMFAAYMDPHDPYYPHPYDGTGYSRAANQKPEPEEADKLRALYEGEIAFWDERFGELLAALDKRGLYDDTTIIVTSDHGEEFMEHGGFWHGTTLYDELLRVPLFVKLPGNARAGTVVSHWVQGVDIMPTILKQAGLEVPEGVQGGNLWQPQEALFAEEDHEGNVLRALRMRRGGSEVKLIEANVGNPRGLQPMELYRVDQDPGELVDLAREEMELLKLSATRLEQQASDARVGRATRSEVNLAADAAAMEKLRALGYAGGD